jgi:hypothetical protein
MRSNRELPLEKELSEHIPVEMFDTAQHISSGGPFLVARLANYLHQTTGLELQPEYP